MDALHPIDLDQDLDIIRYGVPGVEAAVARGLVVDPKKLQELLLVNAYFGTDLGQALIGLVASLVHNIDVVEGLGIIK